MPESPLLRLPEEIRREIFLHLVRPAEEMTICPFKKQRTLVAVTASVKNHAHKDANGPGKQ